MRGKVWNSHAEWEAKSETHNRNIKSVDIIRQCYRIAWNERKKQSVWTQKSQNKKWEKFVIVLGEQEVSGFLNQLGVRTPLRKIPLLEIFSQRV